MDCRSKIKELRESTGMNRKEFCNISRFHTGLSQNGSWTTVMPRSMCFGFWNIIFAMRG